LQASGVQSQELPSGALYVVATPIGNLADISLRALWVLSSVDLIAAEDTRVTRTLLERYGIRGTALAAAHRHNERAVAERLLDTLGRGQRAALVSDAGTPAVSDPGGRIVQAVRTAGLRIVPVPGASSILAALSAAGLTDPGFFFQGFAPTGQSEREHCLRALAARGEAFVLMEAPHRVADTAKVLRQVLAPSRSVLIARELTKLFESIDRVAASDLEDWFAAHPPRGEYVLVVERDAGPTDTATIDPSTARWLAALAEALPPARAAAVAARASGLSRDALYAWLTQHGRIRS
jgi:16S rRNA (cytidine1402-2'-O)-methyltransferase